MKLTWDRELWGIEFSSNTKPPTLIGDGWHKLLSCVRPAPPLTETVNCLSCGQRSLVNICKTCIHWKMPEKEDDYNATTICKPLDQDTFEPMKRGFEVRLCKHPAQTLAESPVEDNGFGLVDGSEYFACLATAENFGCVRHEGAEHRVHADVANAPHISMLCPTCHQFHEEAWCPNPPNG